jgi:hypothetical protein
MLVLASTQPVVAATRRSTTARAAVGNDIKLNEFIAIVTAPPNAILAPSGWYLLTAINQGTPSPSWWIHIG